MQSKTENCKWCGSDYTVHQNPVWKKAGFGWNYKGHKGYCSNKCMAKAQGGGGTQGGGGSGGSNSSGILGKISKTIDESTGRKEDRKQTRVDNIAEIEFGTEPAKIANDLNKLITIAGGTKDSAIKRAIAEKMEFGIMQLKMAGKESDAEFFEKKRKKIKPKWYNSND